MDKKKITDEFNKQSNQAMQSVFAYDCKCRRKGMAIVAKLQMILDEILKTTT